MEKLHGDKSRLIRWIRHWPHQGHGASFHEYYSGAGSCLAVVPTTPEN